MFLLQVVCQSCCGFAVSISSKLTPEYDNDRRKAGGKNENNENVISATCLVLYDDNNDSDLMAVCWPVHFKKASHLLLMVAFTQKLC